MVECERHGNPEPCVLCSRGELAAENKKLKQDLEKLEKNLEYWKASAFKQAEDRAKNLIAKLNGKNELAQAWAEGCHVGWDNALRPGGDASVDGALRQNPYDPECQDIPWKYDK